MSPTAAPDRSVRPKTAPKTASKAGRNGVCLPVGNHAGNTGGKKGRSGRKPASWGLFIETLRESHIGFRRSIEQIANDPDNRNFGHVLKLVRDYDPDAPERKIRIEGSVVLGIVAMPMVERPLPPADVIARAEHGEVVQPIHPPAPLARLRAMAGG